MTEEKRKKKNRKRIEQRKRAAARAENALKPPLVALSKEEFDKVVYGASDQRTVESFNAYERYAKTFIAGATKAGRRWEFPIIPASGVSFPSKTRHRKGATSGG